MVALTCTGFTHRVARHYATTSLLFDELLALAEEKGAAYWKAAGTVLQGELSALTGRTSFAVQTITSGLAAMRLTGATVYIPTYLSSLARAMPFTFPLYTRAREATRSSLPAEFLFSLFEGGRRSGELRGRWRRPAAATIALPRLLVLLASRIDNAEIGGRQCHPLEPLAGRGSGWRRRLLARLRSSAGNNGKTRRLLSNRPCSGFSTQSLIPNERLRVSDWIVQRLYHYAVNKTVEF